MSRGKNDIKCSICRDLANVSRHSYKNSAGFWEELASAGKTSHFVIARIMLYTFTKLVHGYKIHDLREDDLSGMH